MAGCPRRGPAKRLRSEGDKMPTRPPLGNSQEVFWTGATSGLNFTSAAYSSSTVAAGVLTGAPICVVNNTGATPGTLTPRTAAQMIGDSGLLTGQTWLLILNNDQGTGTLTLGTATGVTVVGTATAAPNTATWFQGSMATGSTITFTRLFNVATAA